MITIDYIFLLFYFIGIVIIGVLFSSKMKNSKDMFVAGRNSSWWISGLSSYMTLFSAGTFVVWGGIAYRLGLVAVSILMIISLATIFVGKYIAGKWRELGINSPAEYLGIRFGRKTVSFFTIIGLVGRAVTTAVAIYAVSVLLSALIPFPEGNILSDPETGYLSVTYSTIILGLICIIYTIAGGLWAVLMTDVVQFIVLSLMVLLMIPLSLQSVGGLNTFIDNSPEGFFSLVNGEYSLIWLVLWGLSNFFMVGGDWPFVQRYISVPSVKDAKKSAYLVAALYFITPLFWMLPALIYQVINPHANPEQAYILMSQNALPAGLLGLMMAAMISATMSMMDSMLNVFAGVFTFDIYHFYNPKVSEKKLIFVGRLFTLLFGVLIICLALLIPLFGGAESVIISIVTLVIAPLAIPSIWGLFSKKIGQKSVWISLGAAYLAGIIVKFGFSQNGLLVNSWKQGEIISTYIQNHIEIINPMIGMFIPIVTLAIIEIDARRKTISKGWTQINSFSFKSSEAEAKKAPVVISKLPFLILIFTIALLGVIIGWLSIVNEEGRNILMFFSILILSISLLIYVAHLFNNRKKNAKNI